MIVDPVDLPTASSATPSSRCCLRMKADLAYLAGRAGARSGRSTTSSRSRGARDREMPFFGQDSSSRPRRAGSTDRRTSTRWPSAAGARDEGIDPAIEAEASTRWLRRRTAPRGSSTRSTATTPASASTPAAVAGYPHVTVPAGYVSGCRSACRSSAAAARRACSSWPRVRAGDGTARADVLVARSRPPEGAVAVGRIAIAAAMQEEIGALLTAMTDEQVVVLAGREFWLGHLEARTSSPGCRASARSPRR